VRFRSDERKEHEMDSTSNEANETVPTVEELELQWWEPLGCKCDVDFED
jgi:hypothetical protein